MLISGFSWTGMALSKKNNVSPKSELSANSRSTTWDFEIFEDLWGILQPSNNVEYLLFSALFDGPVN